MNHAAACIQNCSFLGMNDAQFVLGTPPGVLKGLIERLYKKTIEEAFYEVSGLNLQLVCQETTVIPEVRPAVEDIQEDVPPPTDEDFGIDELNEVEKQRLDTAIEVFGDGLVHPEDIQQ